MLIGELADRLGLSSRTIRYYESVGLLPEPDRTQAGYRLYGQEDINRLAFIRRAAELDLRLDEIKEILALRESGQRPCAYVLQTAQQRLAELDGRLAAMQKARTELADLIDRAEDLPAPTNSYCQLIDHHQG